MAVTRCVCFNKTFAELRVIAEREGAATLEALQQHVVFGQNCKLCHPYVRRMLETGQSVFQSVISTEDSLPSES